jgi:hypothetical protein
VSRTEFKPDWKLSPAEQMQVDLSLALTKHVPGWPGATDEQIEAVARQVIDGQDSRLTARIAELEKALLGSSSALEAIVFEALSPYREELTIGQMRMLADVIAREFRARTTLEASERGGEK